VIADSEHARQDLVERFGLDPARVPVVPLAMPAAFGAAPPAEAIAALRAHHGLGERLVACIGTIQPRKRVERVIDAFVRARAADRGWELAIAGRLRPGYAPRGPRPAAGRAGSARSTTTRSALCTAARS
jgi:glycosyltransferase involved in cell wall biosynthesis